MTPRIKEGIARTVKLAGAPGGWLGRCVHCRKVPTGVCGVGWGHQKEGHWHGSAHAGSQRILGLAAAATRPRSLDLASRSLGLYELPVCVCVCVCACAKVMIPIMLEQNCEFQQPYIPTTTPTREFIVQPCRGGGHTGDGCSPYVQVPATHHCSCPVNPHSSATRHVLNARVPYRSPQTSPMHPWRRVCVCVCVCDRWHDHINERSVWVSWPGTQLEAPVLSGLVALRFPAGPRPLHQGPHFGQNPPGFGNPGSCPPVPACRRASVPHPPAVAGSVCVVGQHRPLVDWRPAGQSVVGAAIRTVGKVRLQGESSLDLWHAGVWG